ncbi:hypothetical protein ACFQE5_16855 [Pseudonocardia hispaniensis]|uniref:Uncharacterized protein n=1 Tax=Pseudonocardia hispaniensis TaxID=904933 RepID=A0ABW1J542_9PSEU
MKRTRLVSATLLSALVAALTIGWATAAKADPAANRGWDSGPSYVAAG